METRRLLNFSRAKIPTVVYILQDWRSANVDLYVASVEDQIM